MDQGTDAATMLRGEDVPLRLGYVGVKMRSQQDIVNKKPVKDSLKDEKVWFENHRVYSNLELSCVARHVRGYIDLAHFGGTKMCQLFMVKNVKTYGPPIRLQ